MTRRNNVDATARPDRTVRTRSGPDRVSSSVPVGPGLRLTLVGPPGDVHWTLSAGNGRTLGVGEQSQADAVACEADFTELAANAVTLSSSVRHRGQGRGWTWVVVDVNGRVRARANSHYERHGTCARAVARFVTTLREIDDQR